MNYTHTRIRKEYLAKLHALALTNKRSAMKQLEVLVDEAPRDVTKLEDRPDVKLAINKAVGEARINELEIMPSSTFNHPYREYVKQRLAALKEAK